MAGDDKWLDVDPDDDVNDIVTTALRGRCQRVRGRLDESAKKHPDPESIHQLRVAVRRGRAALTFFQPMLPPRRTRKLNRALRDIRRAAGPARDLDVMLARFRTAISDPTSDDQHRSAVSNIIDQLSGDRRQVQSVLRPRLAALRPAIDESALDRLLAKIRWRGEGPVPDWPSLVRSQLPESFIPFSSAARGLLSSPEHLHQLRIDVKRLRYALELAVSYDPAIRAELCPLMQTIQDRLGIINDHAVAVEHLTTLRARFDKPEQEAVNRLIEWQRTERDAGVADFLDWWDQRLLGEIEQTWYAIFQDDPGAGDD